MTLKYTRPALADLEHILDYLALHSPHGAGRVARALQSAERRIAQFPRSGILTDMPAIRRVKLPRFPYLVFYQVTEGGIIVHAVRHAARDPATMPGRI